MKIDFFRYIGNGNKWVVNSIINPVMHNAGKWLKNLTVLTSQDPHEKIKRKEDLSFTKNTGTLRHRLQILLLLLSKFK